MGRSSCSPYVPWPILLIFAPFFWVVKSNMANMAALRSAVLEVYVKMVCPYDRVVSLRWKGVLSDVELFYSPVQISKKYPRMIMLQVPHISGLGEAADILKMLRRTLSSISFTWFGVGSS